MTPPTIALESIALPSWPFRLLGIAYGQGRSQQLEVLYSEADRSPSPTQLRSAWKARQDRRGVPLLVVVLYGGKAQVCGPSGEDPTVFANLDPGQVERVCQEALEQPSRQAALHSLRDSLASLEEEGLPGLRNEGFLAAHELTSGVPARSDWSPARSKSREVLGSTGTSLLGALGYSVEPLDKVTHILKAKNHKTAVAILLNEQESPEAGSQRIPGSMSPVSYALARADDENLDWVILVHGRKIRLYPVKPGVGVGRRGRTETYVECHTGLIAEENAGYLWLLFSADALAKEGSLSSILENSKDFAGDLATRLRERIYVEVIPRLAEGLAQARGIANPTAADLEMTYQMAMRVLFRILFIAYGEDKDLLPYRFNGLYKKRSLKAKAKELLELTAIDHDFDSGDSWWAEVKNIFRAVDQGNRDWGVPAYNGGLFSSKAEDSSVGAALAEVSLPNDVFGPVLQHLLLVPTAEGVLGPVDFRSLGVREFGTIYEGLLESELSVAETDLTIKSRGKNKDSYRPCKKGEEVLVPKGAIYLHNASGARKATGSYYTKHFAVEHLLDRALEPALDDHFARLDALDKLEAAEAFFDLRVADIAMGSGHFLVAAVDRIEARFSWYLAKRPLPLVSQELDHLRKAALEALAGAADSYPDFEDTALLRRLIARRCIYGVDINEVAVQLARLGIWIHTFVPGLPLSLLDRNLIHGNSLVGVGQLGEFNDELSKDQTGKSGTEAFSASSLFQIDASTFLGDAEQALTRLGRIADATIEEVKQARKAWQEADAAVAPTRALCDILTASRIKGEPFPILLDDWEHQKASVPKNKTHRDALQVLQDMHPIHFPVAFPEVFLRERAGFDVILGNPPWEKVRVEEHAFWARFFPGIRGLSQREREAQISEHRKSRPDLVAELGKETKTAFNLRRALTRGPFPGMGTGDPDLYKAFCWRFWFLTTEPGGRIGVVLPRSAWVSKGMAVFRENALSARTTLDLSVLVNRKGWVFPGVHEQNPVPVLSVIGRGFSPHGSAITLRGPFMNLDQFLKARVYPPPEAAESASLVGEEVMTWTSSASLPLLPSDESSELFSQLRKAPRFDLKLPGQWRGRPYRELDATNDKPLMDLASEICPIGYWPVYKGASFDLWEPDTGEYYAWADPKVVEPVLHQKRQRGHHNIKSVFHECESDWCADPKTLPCLSPRIAFRDVTNRTNRRTVICALIPPCVFLNHTAPFFIFPKYSPLDSAYLLGVFSSIVLDWYSRRFVENHLTFFVLNPFPIPRPEPDNPFRLRAIELAGRLACPDDRFADWAKEVGVECGRLEEGKKQDMIHELDAVVAHLYGLTHNHLVHLFETFHEGWDYVSVA